MCGGSNIGGCAAEAIAAKWRFLGSVGGNRAKARGVRQVIGESGVQNCMGGVFWAGGGMHVGVWRGFMVESLWGQVQER